jgi:hypothetical protein
MVLSVNGGDRVSFTFDEIDADTGEQVSANDKRSFYAMDADLKANIQAIRDWIADNKLS